MRALRRFYQEVGLLKGKGEYRRMFPENFTYTTSDGYRVPKEKLQMGSLPLSPNLENSWPVNPQFERPFDKIFELSTTNGMVSRYSIEEVSHCTDLRASLWS